MSQTQPAIINLQKEIEIRKISQILRVMPFERVSLVLRVLQVHQVNQNKVGGFQAYPIVTYTESLLATN